MHLRCVPILALALSAQAGAEMDIRDGLIMSPMPDLHASLPVGAVVVQYDVDVVCAGVGAIEGLPDGWDMSLAYDGEVAHLRISRAGAEAWLTGLDAEDRKAAAKELDDVEVGVIHRGQWSDCIGMDAEVVALTPVADGTWRRVQAGWHSYWGDGWERKDVAAP